MPQHPGVVRAARGPLAGFGRRAVSFLIDCVAPVIILSLLLPTGALISDAGWSLVVDAVAFLGLLSFGIWNSGYLQGATGCSIGRRVAGTKLLSIETGRPVGFRQAVTRQICHLLEFGIGYLRPLWDRKRQTFADKIAGTIVVRAGWRTDHRRLGQ